MCGIAGFWAAPEPEEQGRQALQRMAAALRHRGPDSHGLWLAPEAGLGLAHARLAIVDLSPAGHQPMLSDDERFCVSYNGEIYNFMELRAELDAAGKTPAGGWRGRCDTEVLLAAVAAWGLEAAVSRFVGMFAFALWDGQRRKLHLVRDRMGIKPLYLGYSNGCFLFGSELKALRQHPAWQGELSCEALARYLRLACVPAPLSIYQGIYKLMPGSIATLSSEELQARRLPEIKRYWSVPQAAAAGWAAPLSGDENELTDMLETSLLDAVKMRLVADVPLGVFLSGGVDSSTVTALMQELCSRPVRSFSIGSHARDYDESAAAAAVARHLGTEHTALMVAPEEAMDAIRLMPGIYDEPFADASQVPTWLVSRLAREQVIVCLSGDGGDELFAGYNRHFQAPRLWKALRSLPRPLRAMLGRMLPGTGEAVLASLYEMLSHYQKGTAQPLLRHKLQKVVEALPARDRQEFYDAIVAVWQREDALLQQPRPQSDPAEMLLAPPEFLPQNMDFTSWMMARDQCSYLPDDILTKLDRASMAVSLEGRVPLLDHRVVELAWRLPAGSRIKNGEGKQMLRRVLYRRVPRELVERPKQGFDLPLDAWLRNELRDWAEALLAPEALLAAGLRAEPVRKAWREHQKGGRNRHLQLWTVLMYMAWLEENRAS